MEPGASTIETSDLWARFIRVSQALLAAVEAELKAKGFPPLGWYDALLELRRGDPEGLRPFELQEHMLLAQYNMSRLIDRLVQAGYARRRKCPDDARGQVIHVTEKGRALLDAMWPAYRAAIAAHFGGKLTPGQAGPLGEALEALRPARSGGSGNVAAD